MWPTHWASIPQHHHPLITPTDWLALSFSPRHCVWLVCLVERRHLFGPYLCSCLVRYSNASAVCLATPSEKQQWRGKREGEGEGETLISQQLKADKQGGAQRKGTEPCCDPQLQRSNRHPFLTPFASKGAAPIFTQALSSAPWFERWSTKWWSRWGYVCGRFIFNCVSLIRSTTVKGGLNGVWRKIWCANNPLGRSCVEIKYCSIEMGGGSLAVSSVNLVLSRQRANFRSFLCPISSYAMPRSCSSKYNSQLLHYSQAWSGHANQ